MEFTFANSLNRTGFKQNYLLWLITFVFTIVWANSLIWTSDINNWLLENALTFLFLVVLFLFYKKYQFSDLTYLLIGFYLCLHVYGSKHTYAENPFGYWLQDVFQSERNHYDRIVHFSLGFLLAYPMRELFLKWFQYPKMVGWILPIEITLSISGLYELIEWAVADVFFQEQGVAYLGTQGDIWDAQKDIFLAFSGALLSTSIVSILKKVIVKG
jgi:putative membrane protein